MPSAEAEEHWKPGEHGKRRTTADEPAADDGTSAEGAWLELSVAADIEAVEAVSEILGRVAPGGTSVEPAFELVEEGLAATVDISRPAVVRAYVPARDAGAARAAVAEAREALGHLQAFGLRPIGDLETRVVHEADWAEAWKEHFPVLRVGRRLVIKPTWRRHRRRAGDVVLALDPGMAFGTGLHPTTRLCLAAIETLADGGKFAVGAAADGSARVLDVGIGSGILAIAAGLLGAGEIVGVDPDAIAVEAARTNAGRNRLGDRLMVRQGSVPTREPAFDVVLANLIASLLVALAGQLRDELRPGGVLVASGIFIDREADVRTAFEAVGLGVTGRSAEGEWVALTALREPVSRSGAR
ncbi:MAG TPA: 50S ribosomal protein L11 methyltransferase [Candidatus Acidoferrum sp.]|nr:50S ribosomal protein L11 methyltransferase [Candidatus Acidoferrum sp.]